MVFLIWFVGFILSLVFLVLWVVKLDGKDLYLDEFLGMAIVSMFSWCAVIFLIILAAIDYVAYLRMKKIVFISSKKK